MTDATADIPLDRLDSIGQLLERIAEELAFVEEGSDLGLLPINALLMDLEEGPGMESLPSAFRKSVAVARRWLDSVLDGSGRFAAADITNLQQWIDWLMEWLAASVSGQPTAELPLEWSQSEAVAVASLAPPAIHLPAFPAADAPVKSDAEAMPVAAARSESTPIIVEGDVATFTLQLPKDLDLLREFHAESLELLESIEHSVLALEENPTDADAVNSVFRVFHTFKGSAGFLKFDAMQRFAHDLESLLDAARSGSLAVSRAVIDAILKGGDVLSSCMREVGAQLAGDRPGTPIAVPSAQVLEMIRRALAPDSSPPAVAAPVATAPPPGERVETAVVQTQAPAAEQAKSAPRETVAASEATSIRVDAAKLDDMVNLVGELVIAQAMVIGGAEGSQLADVDRDQAMRSLMRITRELQRNATTLRMVPVSGLFRKMTRLVRDLSAQVGKQVRLELVGEDTELDRQLVDRMGDPLLHMIRNAVDHGVELPAERQAAGKDPVGIVRLSASHESGGVVIRVADDGRGLDGDRLLAKALEKGLIKGDGPRSLAERLELIFLPGFSTASAVTDISGRGVGMDVVRRHIEGLRGAIDIASTVGVGTTFTIRLPLTLALIDGLLVRVGGERYVLPTLAVRECFRPEPGAVSAVHEQGEIVNLRGHQIPVLRLGAYLQKAAQSLDPCEGILVVIEAAGTVRAVLVDELLGKQDMIIKKLGNTFDGNPVVSGGAVLGDGSVGLILSADALVRATREVAA